jgi:hypothetical protein
MQRDVTVCECRIGIKMGVITLTVARGACPVSAARKNQQRQQQQQQQRLRKTS